MTKRWRGATATAQGIEGISARAVPRRHFIPRALPPFPVLVVEGVTMNSPHPFSSRNRTTSAKAMIPNTVTPTSLQSVATEAKARVVMNVTDPMPESASTVAFRHGERFLSLTARSNLRRPCRDFDLRRSCLDSRVTAKSGGWDGSGRWSVVVELSTLDGGLIALVSASETTGLVSLSRLSTVRRRGSVGCAEGPTDEVAVDAPADSVFARISDDFARRSCSNPWLPRRHETTCSIEKGWSFPLLR